MLQYHLIESSFRGLLALITTLAFIKLFRGIAIKINLVDAPNHRKHHEQAVPLVGGVAMLLGFSLAMLTITSGLYEYRSLLVGSILLLVTGILDDFKELSPTSKFISQVFVALLVVAWGGMHIDSLGKLFYGHAISLNTWAIPFSVVLIVGIINSINMIDGADGLGGSILLTQFFSLFIANLTFSSIDAMLLMALCGALVGFLYFNLPLHNPGRVNVFMGDAGSLFMGFVLSWFLIKFCQNGIIYPITALWITAIPFLDATHVCCKRVLNGDSPFKPDRTHLHHLLTQLGVRPKQVVFYEASASAMLGLIALAANRAGVPEGSLCLGFMGMSAVYVLLVNYLWSRTRRHR